MKNFLIAILILGQITASIKLGFIEGWGAGLVFFIITSIFIGFMLNIAEGINRIFGDKN